MPLPKKKFKYTYIDLFAGCGGLSLGLFNAGWHGLFAIEKSKDAFATLKYNLIDKKKHFNWPKWLPQRQYDINYVLSKYKEDLKRLKGNVTLVTGGPPCQGFSMAGLRNEKDKRNKLINAYIRFIDIVQPKLIFFENVKGFTMGFKKENSKTKTYSRTVKNKLKKLGYDIEARIIDFSEFGIPQKRKRFILVGVKNGEEGAAKIFFEKLIAQKAKFLKSKKLTIDVTLEEAISDLLKSNGTQQTPDRKSFKSGVCSKANSKYQVFMRRGKKLKGKVADSHSFAKHSIRIEDKFEYIMNSFPKNQSIKSNIKKRFKTLKRTVVPLARKDKTPTLTTLPDDYIHYQEPRILTVREYARIQSFPDWFEIKGKYTTGGELRTKEVPRYTQIGNAIPPLFGEHSGNVLKEMM